MLAYGSLFRIPNLSKEEVADAMRDLDNPFLQILRRRINEHGQVEVRLSTISRAVVQTSSEFGKMLSNKIATNIRRLRILARGGQPTTTTTTISKGTQPTTTTTISRGTHRARTLED